jgi:hypothetical protein
MLPPVAPEIEDMLMMQPPPFSFMCATACLMPEDGVQVYPNAAVPFVFGRGEHVMVDHDPSIVDEDVEATPPCNGLVDDLLHAASIRDVPLLEEDFRAQPLHIPSESRDAVVNTQVKDGDTPAPRLGELQRDRPANPLRRPRHDGDLLAQG